MPISEEHVGRCYPATDPYVVSRAKIVEFATAVGDTTGQPVDGPAVASPTFAMVIAAQAWGAMFDDAELGLALKRTVHGEQKFSWARPLHEGDVVSSVLTIDKVRARGGIDWVTLSVTLSVAGEDVCVATSTLMHTREEEAA